MGVHHSVTPWTASEERWLRELAPSMTLRQLCEKLERTKHSVANRLEVLGVNAMPQNHRWMKAEVKLIEANINDHTYAGLAAMLGRSEASVRAFINRNKMAEVPRKKTKEYIINATPRIIMLHKRGLTLTRIGQLIDVDRGVVRRVLQKEGRLS